MHFGMQLFNPKRNDAFFIVLAVSLAIGFKSAPLSEVKECSAQVSRW